MAAPPLDDSTHRTVAAASTTDGLLEAVPPEMTGTLFVPYVVYPVGSHSQAVAIGDLNGDGRNDVALVTSYDHDPDNDYTLFVFHQREDGSLATPVRYPLGLEPRSVRIADLNDDGRQDVVVGRLVEVVVLYQTAAGLSSPAVVGTSRGLRVGVGDFNGDGRVDGAGIYWGSQDANVDVLLQTPRGLAVRQTILGAHGGYDDVDVGDLNADGRDDLVVMSGQGEVPNVAVFSQAEGGLLLPPEFHDLGGNELTHGVAVGDWNDDGLDDLAVSFGGNRPSSLVAVWLQEPGGTFAAPWFSKSYDNPQPVELADVTGDGRADLLVAHGGWHALGVYAQDGLGEELYPLPGGNGYNPHGLAIGDLDGDGTADVAVADVNHGLVVLRHVPMMGAPGAPRRLTCRLHGRRLALTWAPGGGAARYRIERAIQPGGRFVEIGQTTTLTRFFDKTADRKRELEYRVTAVNPQGEASSTTTWIP